MPDTKVELTEREVLTAWVESSNSYELLVWPEDRLDKLRKARECSKAIDVALKECADKIRKLGKKYRSLGIGDTSTDEAITAVFYAHYLH